MMKKILAVLLIFCLLFVMVGCSAEPKIETEEEAIETTEEVTSDIGELTQDLEDLNEELGG